MQLEQFQKKRLKIYRQHLKKQIQEREQLQKKQKQSIKRSESIEMQELINRVKDYDLLKKIQCRKQAKQLNQDNLRITMNRFLPNPQHTQAYTHEEEKMFTSHIYEGDKNRLIKQKQMLYEQQMQNQNQQKIKRQYNNMSKSFQMKEQEKHNDQLKKTYEKSINYYNHLRNKHAQNMDNYQRFRQVNQKQEKYKQQLRKAFYSKEEIFAKIKRSQEQDRHKKHIQIQQQLKKQMQEINNRKIKEKIQYNSPDNLQKSMLNSVLMKLSKPNNLYVNDLKKQMSQRLSKQKQQRNQMKEKYQVNGINGIFAGKHGNDRFKQLEYIDKRLGLEQPGRNTQPIYHIPTPKSRNDKTMHSQRQGNIMNKSNNDIMKTQRKKEDMYEFQNKNTEIKTGKSNYDTQEKGTKKYLSFDLVTGTNRYYDYDIAK